ncbi:MAG: MMPL family transporter, partial [Bacilli bacterium]
MKRISMWSSTRKGSLIVLAIWMALVTVLSVTMPSGKEYEQSSQSESIHEDTLATEAGKVLKKHFPSDGLLAIMVFHRADKLDENNGKNIASFSEWLAGEDAPKSIQSTLPLHLMPPAAQKNFYSEDNTTLFFTFSLADDADSDVVYETLETVRKEATKQLGNGVQFEITGPAGISSDTKAIFKNADFVLMLGTVVLIFVLLIVIYRSLTLAI